MPMPASSRPTSTVTLAEEMGEEFRRVPLSDVSTDTLVDWIKGYFSPDA